MNSTTTNLRRAQLSARAPRALFYAFVTIFCLVGLKSMFAPAEATPVRAPAAPETDWSATAFAQAFAREYLTWKAGEEPTDREKRLAPFLASDLDPSGGVVPGERTEQLVTWTTAMGVARDGDHQVVTVQAGTSTETVYLAVPVLRDAERRLAIDAYPAFVGPPATSTAAPAEQETDVDDAALRGVVERALRNYLSGSRDDLLADLTDDAVVSPPQQRLTLTGVEQVTWVNEPRRVAAEVAATDERGTRLRLRYELEVRNAGRWFVRSVHIDPTYGGGRP
jgi:Conjugative transposon protein TcpC